MSARRIPVFLLALAAGCPLVPGGASAQIVHLANVIIDGSLCVGLDCTSGEAFGFDTIRLKENNLRIMAVDTSSSASFPRNDWQIVFNQSSNGGANYFAVRDCGSSDAGGSSECGTRLFAIEAGADNDSIYVESAGNQGGNVGFGTSNPALDLHVLSGNTPALRLEQDGSSGFTPQTWDVAGNEAGFFIRDATSGSTLPFRIRPGAGSSVIDIQGNERVGINDATPDATLDVEADATSIGPGNVVIRMSNTGGPGDVAFQMDANDDGSFWNTTAQSGGNYVINNNDGPGSVEFTLTAAGNLTLEGDLITGGGGNCAPPNPPCDGLFLPGYELESIEEHAAFMWQNSHLPAVGPTAQGQPINLTVKTQGILNELEKAHIYIERLHRRLQQKEAVLAEVMARLEALEQPR